MLFRSLFSVSFIFQFSKSITDFGLSVNQISDKGFVLFSRSLPISKEPTEICDCIMMIFKQNKKQRAYHSKPTALTMIPLTGKLLGFCFSRLPFTYQRPDFFFKFLQACQGKERIKLRCNYNLNFLSMNEIIKLAGCTTVNCQKDTEKTLLINGRKKIFRNLLFN